LKDKAPLERTADRLARLFLPAVLSLAVLTFLVSLLALAGPFRPPAHAAPAAILALQPDWQALHAAVCRPPGHHAARPAHRPPEGSTGDRTWTSRCRPADGPRPVGVPEVGCGRDLRRSGAQCEA